MACSEQEIMVIEKDTSVLEQPFPTNYPSTNPRPNNQIGVLKKGERHKVIAKKHEKDYLVYTVRLENGKTGYVIHSNDHFKITSQ